MQYHTVWWYFNVDAQETLILWDENVQNGTHFGCFRDVSQYLGSCDRSWSGKLFAIRRCASSMSSAYGSCSEELTNTDCFWKSCFFGSFHNLFLLRWFSVFFSPCSFFDSGSTWSPTTHTGGLQQSKWSPTARIDCTWWSTCSATVQNCGLWRACAVTSSESIRERRLES